MPTKKLEDYFDSQNIQGWEQLNEFYESRFRPEVQWIFRGQRGSCQGLKTSIEREIKEFRMDLEQAPDIERGLLRKFKRSCHHYVPDTPEESASLEWLALMQHHGAPTRLLDWTYSFFAALYFAIESADKQGYTVWALNTDWMDTPFKSVLSGYPDALQCWQSDPAVLRQETFKKLYNGKPPIALAGAVTPRRLSDRLVIQQGVFLCPGDVSRTFEENLIALLSPAKPESKDNFIKINIEASDQRDVRKHILLRLQRMNMNRATLFPGLDGFAESLKTLMASPTIFLAPGDEEL